MEVLSASSPMVADHSFSTVLSTNDFALDSNNDKMSTMESSQYLALGDVHHDDNTSNPASPSTYQDSSELMLSSTPPPPVIIQSRPAKKRKSWGQELPEPKTTLPPRKRAKTDDEKEQRRIERIKRNRAAAHNSRERKRQETETLAVALARANAELDAYKKLHGPLPDHIILPEVTLCTDDADTPPSMSDSRSSISEAAHSPATPADSIFHINDHIDIKQEPSDLASTIHLSPKFLHLDNKPSPSVLGRFDPTQHSAEMLCDLPCRSNHLPSSSRTNSGWSPASASSLLPPHLITRLFLFIMTSQLQQCYRTLMLALWATSPSRMARLIRLSAIRSSPLTTSSTIPPPSRSTLGCLALSRTATGSSAPAMRVELDGERGSRISTSSVESTESVQHWRTALLESRSRSTEEQKWSSRKDASEETDGLEESI